MNVVLVSLDPDIAELRNLTESLNYSIDKVFIQKRELPSSKYYVGDGKVREIAKYLQDNSVDLIIFNAKLKASQFFNLERILKKSVYDRIRLILEIFNDRAYSREAKLQVELARLQFEIPLVNEWIHRSKKGEHPGFLAGGEYAVQQYYDLIRKRIKKNKERLDKMKKERSYRRGHRKKFGFYLVSLAGYTNAGKSTLLNNLTESNVVVEKRVFSTLTPTTRKITEGSRQILLTDTVGFIRDLPPWLIESFHSTLEEIFYSDIILLIIDISEELDEIKKKINTCQQILWTSENVPTIIPVFNKIDIIEMREVRSKINDLKRINLVEDYVFISAKENLFLDNLIDRIHESLPKLSRYKVAVYTYDSKSIIDFIEENYNVINLSEIDMEENVPDKYQKYDLLDKKIIVEFEGDSKIEPKLNNELKKLNGTKLTVIQD
jgi:GTP-binding protein HflX